GARRRGLLGRLRLNRDGDRRIARLKHAADLALDIVRELARARLGEVHAVGAAQLADLAFEVGALGDELAALVGEAIPHIDIDDAVLVGARAIDLVEEGRIGARTRAADRRQADPEHRDALALHRRDRLVDPLAVELDPLLRAILMGADRA